MLGQAFEQPSIRASHAGGQQPTAEQPSKKTAAVPIGARPPLTPAAQKAIARAAAQKAELMKKSSADEVRRRANLNARAAAQKAELMKGRLPNTPYSRFGYGSRPDGRPNALLDPNGWVGPRSGYGSFLGPTRTRPKALVKPAVKRALTLELDTSDAQLMKKLDRFRVQCVATLQPSVSPQPSSACNLLVSLQPICKHDSD